MADPGTGDIRLNNASFASVTAVAVDALTAQSGNPDLSDFIATWDDSSNPTTKGYIRLSKGGAPENFAIYQITGVTDNTGWLQLTVTHVDSAGSFTAADTLYLTFTRTGDQGSLTASGNNDFTGTNTFAGKTAFKDDGELTIATGAITITGAAHTVDTESDAASDDLDTINGGTDGELLVLRAENAARTIVIKDGTGNIETADGNDIDLDETEKTVLLQYDAALSKWLVISSPSSGAATGTYLGRQIFTTSGSFTKATYPTATKFRIIGTGGGGGGGSAGASNYQSGGGGEAGATFILDIDASSLSASEAVTIGAAGAAGSAGNGGTGGTTSFGAHATAPGGEGGFRGGAAGDIDPTATGGDINIRGGQGHCGMNSGSSNRTTSMGGASYWGGGGGAERNTAYSSAGEARAYGSGGAGGKNATSPELDGGAGMAGIVVVEAYT
jgi:hypothetical protein